MDIFSNNFSNLYDVATEAINDRPDKYYLDTSRYSEIVEIGRGSSKIIYRAYDNNTQRYVAMAKAIYDDKDAVYHFFREAKINAYLQHPNIMPVYDIGYHDQKPCFTMKLSKGKSLQEYLKQGSYNLDQRLEIFFKICDAINYAHHHAVLHLDLKMENIQFDEFGEILICDWGICQIYDDILDEEESILDKDLDQLVNLTLKNKTMLSRGTPGYMAPEQIVFGGEVSCQTDIYSLGVLLFVFLTDQLPQKSSDLDDILQDTINGNIKTRDEFSKKIPVGIEAVCFKAMSKNSCDRYQSVTNLIDDLEKFKAGYATEAENASLWMIFVLLYRRNRLLFISTSLFVLVIISLFFVYLRNLSLSEKQARESERKIQKSQEKLEKSFIENQVINKEIQKLLIKSSQLSFLRANNHIEKEMFAEAKKDLEHALSINKSYKDAKILYAMYSLATFSFDKALPIFEKYHTKYYKQVSDILKHKKYKYDLYNFIKEKSKSKLHLLFLKEFVLNEAKTKEEYAFFVEKLFNYKIKRDKLLFSKDANNLITLNLSCLPKMTKKDFILLSKFPIKNLTIEGVNLSNIPRIEMSYLESLTIRKTSITAIKNGTYPKLKYLDLSNNKKLKKSSWATVFPSLEEINISNTAIKTANVFLELANLKRITLDKNCKLDYEEESINKLEIIRK